MKTWQLFVRKPIVRRIALGGAGILIVSTVAVRPAHSQFGIDIAAILAGLKEINSTLGSAVAGLRECRTQHRVNTPRPVWNPDIENPFQFREHWQDVPDNQTFDNGFKAQWELFLRHIADDAPFPHDFLEGARGVQLAELGLKSWQERRWIDVPELKS